MTVLPDLIRQYAELLDEERRLTERKGQLRAEILEALGREELKGFRCPSGTAQRSTRFKLHPKQDRVLELLDGEDLYPFAQFTPAKVKELLVPKYGRERLLPLFDVETTEFLQIRRSSGSG